MKFIFCLHTLHTMKIISKKMSSFVNLKPIENKNSFCIAILPLNFDLKSLKGYWYLNKLSFCKNNLYTMEIIYAKNEFS